jgi:hypothetical protein
MTRLTTFALVFVLAVVVAVSGRAPAPLAAMAAPLVERFGDGPRTLGLPVATGRFGTEMQIALVNDGPLTIWLDTAELSQKTDMTVPTERSDVPAVASSAPASRACTK